MYLHAMIILKCHDRAWLIAGLLVASYWAARYFATLAASLWLAYHARKQWKLDLVATAAVVAACYAAFVRITFSLWAGYTDVLEIRFIAYQYISVPASVAAWARHNGMDAWYLAVRVRSYVACS